MNGTWPRKIMCRILLFTTCKRQQKAINCRVFLSNETSKLEESTAINKPLKVHNRASHKIPYGKGTRTHD